MFFNYNIQQLIIAITVFFGLWTTILVIRKIIINQLHKTVKFSNLTRLTIELLMKTKLFFILAVSLYISATIMNLKIRHHDLVDKIMLSIVVIQIGLWLDHAIMRAVETSGIKEKIEGLLAKGGHKTIISILRIVLWSLILISILGNLGFQVGPLIAGLGIGGIAIALGVQNTLQDIAASLSIIIDKPFMVGDFIIIDSFMGTVECIGIKTTRLSSLTGEQIVFSNNDLLKSRVRNYKQMKERRILFSFKVPYNTPYEKVRKIPSIIREIIEQEEMAKFDRVHLKAFGEYAFEYEVVYLVQEPSYNTYMDLQQRINFKVIENFQACDIEFAYPKFSLAMS